MRRLKLTLAYDGTEFHGWQVQPGLETIQGSVQGALSQIEGRPVHLHGSGRTDAGVHALAQVASFDLANPIPVENLKRAVNRLLPRSIRVADVQVADTNFHARFSAIAKTYEYRIWRTEICPPTERLYVYHHPYPLDEGLVMEAAGILEGEHDFGAFAASDEADQTGRSKVRMIYSFSVRREEERLLFRVRGSGFLKHMVRILVGTLLEVGKGNVSLEQVRTSLQPGTVVKAGPSVPASGLFLVSVEY